MRFIPVAVSIVFISAAIILCLGHETFGYAAYREDANMVRGELHMHNNATSTVITTQSTFTKMSGETALTDTGISYQFAETSEGELCYTGTKTKVFHIGNTVSWSVANANDVFQAVLYKNGTLNGNREYTGGTQLDKGLVEQKSGASGDVVSTAIHVYSSLAQNDCLSLGVSNLSGTGDMTIKHMNLFAMEMGM